MAEGRTKAPVAGGFWENELHAASNAKVITQIEITRIMDGGLLAENPSIAYSHYFQVGKEGARGIDISTLHGKNEGFSFLDISLTPTDSEKRIFEATWNDLLRQAPPKKS